MKDDLKQQLESLIMLIESWKKENIVLALEILKGNRGLRKKVLDYYRPTFEPLFGRIYLNWLLSFPQRLAIAMAAGSEVPKNETIEKLLPIVPLKHLTLNYKRLKNIPWWVFQMNQLITLDLSNNEIEEIPEEISKLENLEILILNKNLLTGLPDSIGKLNKLQKLQLDFNQIELLPESIGNLSNLLWLCLEGNNIKSLPGSCENLQSLYWLSVEKTPLGKKHKIKTGIYTSVSSNDFKRLLESPSK